MNKLQYEASMNNLYAFHKYVMGNFIQLTPPQIEIMNAISEYLETVVIVGSKGGKSTLAAETTLWGCWKMLNLEDPYKKYGLTPGTILYAMNIAPKEDIAVNVILQYIIALAEQSPLYDFIDGEPRRDQLRFINYTEEGRKIKVWAKAQGSSSKAGRGYAIFRVIMDEASSFMDSHGNMGGMSVLNAYMPRLSVFGQDGRLLAITTPRGRSGAAWEMFRTGKPLRVLQEVETQGKHPFRAVFQYATWELNPLPQYAKNSVFMNKERVRDPWMFDREYGGLFADVVSAFLDKDQIDSCVTAPPLPHRDKRTSYTITADPGFEHDSYAMSMGHWTPEDKVRIDLMREWKPPLNIIKIEDYFVDLDKRYNIEDIILDQHLSMATIQRIQDLGLPARGVSFGTRTDMKIYQNLLEMINVNSIELQNHLPSINQLKHLQRIVRGDRYKVEASPGFHDDLADTIAMLAYILNVERRGGGKVLW